jgi:hypothetical protein
MKLLKKLLGLTLLMIIVVAAGMPAVLGLVLRDRIHQILEPLTQTEGVRVEILDIRPHWFRSEISLDISSQIFSADGLTRVNVPATLYVTHGPVMWHLYDSLFALADIQLEPDTERQTAQGTHFSGSAMLTIDRSLNLRITAISGFTAFAGAHWLEGRAHWPLSTSRAGWRTVLQHLDLILNIDADALAIAASPAADALSVYQRQGWTRLSNGRALSHITLQDSELNINGRAMPLGIFFDQP